MTYSSPKELGASYDETVALDTQNVTAVSQAVTDDGGCHASRFRWIEPKQVSARAASLIYRRALQIYPVAVHPPIHMLPRPYLR